MRLISMTDFVLEQEKCLENILQEKLPVIKLANSYAKILNYAKFLKQLLTLGMFVPCDENGNVLGVPNYYECFLDGSYVNYPQLINYENCVRFKKAKEKVLFEGFMNVDTRKEGQIYFALKQSHRKNNIDYIMNDTFGLFFYNASNEKSRLNTIEDLLNFHELILTESAIKQIGV